jgi:succinate-semialdehyde dehydrogenase/glutarate-semialdehyde dehydrogenase
MSSFSVRGGALGDRVRDALRSRLPGTDAPADDIVVEAPFTGEPLGSVPAHGEAAVEAAFADARDAQAAWADRSLDERAAVLLRFQRLVRRERDGLLDLVQREGGKARADALEEVLDVATTARHYAANADEYLASDAGWGAFPVLSEAVQHHHPRGVVGVISPWNYPLTLAVSDALPALLAGNAVVVKPAEETPFCALALADLLAEAGLPADLFQVVTGRGSEVGPHLVRESDYVMFTGSAATGRVVAEQAGRHLTDCSLELGGKNPMLVLADADLDAAVDGAVQGCFTNAGQLCISFERIYVHEAVYEEFLDRFVAATKALELGTALDYGVDVGSLASERQLEKVEAHVADARERGATVHCGGTARPDVGPYFYEPTVLTDLPDDADAACEETFGPVVAVHPVASADAAVERANDSDYGLNAAVFTGDRDRGMALGERIACGTVNVNSAYLAAWTALDRPMGGMQDSGIGRRHGREGVLKYTEAQTVAHSRVPVEKPDGVPGWLYERALAGFLRATERVPFLP